MEAEPDFERLTDILEIRAIRQARAVFERSTDPSGKDLPDSPMVRWFWQFRADEQQRIWREKQAKIHKETTSG